MKRMPLAIDSCLAKIRFRLNRLPLRLFHGALLGVVMGTAFSALAHFIAAALLEQSPCAVAAVSTETPPAPVPKAFLSDADADDDKDGLPNAWEEQFGHDPNDATDAASDFDNDGLTAAQEHHLYEKTAGASGNPCGHWSTRSLSRPDGLEGWWIGSVSSINNLGQFAISYFTFDSATQGFESRLFRVDAAADTWEELMIAPFQSNENPGVMDQIVYPLDINDRGTVALQRNSPDWSCRGGLVLSNGNWVETQGAGGDPIVPVRLNNHDDWIGWGTLGGVWYTMNDGGLLTTRPFPTWCSYSDINDAGEILGTCYDPDAGEIVSFLQFGDFMFSTGLPGDFPVMDEQGWGIFQMPGWMNNFGEFTGKATGGDGTNPRGFVFDGRYDPIRVAGEVVDSQAEVINNLGQVLVLAYLEGGLESRLLYRDGVAVQWSSLLPGLAEGYAAGINDKSEVVYITYDSSEILLISPDQDADGDGMPDDWEVLYGFKPNEGLDSFLDLDDDGLDNYGEFLLRSDPANPPAYDENNQVIDTRPGIDTDGDGIPNVWEWENGLDYADPTDAPLDYDRDGFTNLEEFKLNTDPRGAPAYRVREIGPFDGIVAASMDHAVLGVGRPEAECLSVAAPTLSEIVFFEGTRPGGAQVVAPASWTLQLGNSVGFAEVRGAASASSPWSDSLATAPNGATVRIEWSYPRQIHYWPHSATDPVTVSGDPEGCDIRELYNPRLSPSGVFLAGTRLLESTPDTYEPFVWRMPLDSSSTCKPLKLEAPAGLGLHEWTAIWVNDHGYVVANCTNEADGNSRPVVWKVNQAGDGFDSVQPMEPLDPGSWAAAVGLSNHETPVIAGTSPVGGEQQAVVWSPSGTPVPLGVLEGGSSSEIMAISPGGCLAGLANAFDGASLRNQVFTARPKVPLGQASPDPSQYHLTSNGTTGGDYVVVSEVNDAGEAIGTIYQYSPVYRAIHTIWRHGRTFSLDNLLPAATGYEFDSIQDVNSNGTMLASAWKNGIRERVLLTQDRDTDGDGLPDSIENANQLNPYLANASGADTDGDGLFDLDELRNGTGISTPDSDGDGMGDAWEISWGLLPLDPADAARDPDGDHVSNLRECQIATNPIGVFKVDVRHTDTASQYPSPGSFDDRGGFVLSTPQYQSGESQNGMIWYEILTNYDTYSAQGGPPVPIPVQSHQRYDYIPDWSTYSYQIESLSQIVSNPDTGTISAWLHKFSHSWDGSEASNSEDFRIIPDLSLYSPEEVTSWINLSDVELDAGMSEGSMRYPNAISRDNTRLLCPGWGTGTYREFNNLGNRLWEMPPMMNADGTEYYSWGHINSQGAVAGVGSRWVAETESSPAYGRSTIHYWNGNSVSTTDTPEEWAFDGGYRCQSVNILNMSNDGKLLICRSGYYPGGGYGQRYYVFDGDSGTFSPVTTPATQPSGLSLSSSGGRIVGWANLPFMVTPDGTCVKLAALRVKNTPADPETTLGALYPNNLYPVHITSSGLITCTAYNDSWQQVILQIIPSNDLDNDGIPDDWERHWAEICKRGLDLGQLSVEALAMLNTANLDPYARIGGMDMTALQVYNATGTAQGSSGQDNAQADLYTVELEVGYESREILVTVGLPPLDVAVDQGQPERVPPFDNVRYLTCVTEERFTISDSPIYTNTDDGHGSKTIQSWRQNGRIANQVISDTIDLPGLSVWKSTNARSFSQGIRVDRDVVQEEPIRDITADHSRVGWRKTTGWRITRGGAVLSSGTEVIEEYIETTLSDAVTVPDVFNAMSDSTPYGDPYGPSPPTVITTQGIDSELYASYRMGITDLDVAREAVRREFVDGVRFVGYVSDATISTPSSHAGTRRLASLRYRWLRFNPDAPFVRFPATPPSGYQQRMPLLLSRERRRFDGTFTASDGTEVECEHSPVGVETLVFESNGSATSQSWSEVDLSALWQQKYVVESPHEADLGAALFDWHTGASTTVAFEPIALKIGVDADRDGAICFDGSDRTFQQSPFRFWVNNDQDDVADDEVRNPSSPDCNDMTIKTARDLEDFCRLRIETGVNPKLLRNGSVKVRLTFRQRSSPAPSIRLWANQSPNGGRDYLSDPVVAARQIAKHSCGGSVSGFISEGLWMENRSNIADLIFEGVSCGEGELVAELADSNWNALGETTPGVWIKLLDVREMYRRARIRSEAKDIPEPWINPSPPPLDWVWDPNKLEYSEDPEAKPVTVVHVHGWRMPYLTAINWASTSYKRLWHMGYKGSFYSFRWPTFSGDDNGLVDPWDDWVESSELPPPGFRTYNASEYRAWLSGPALADFVNRLPNRETRHIFAHSMGNVVTGAALRAGMEVSNYALLNAAMAYMAYDSEAKVDWDYATPDTDPDPKVRSGFGLANKLGRGVGGLSKPPSMINFALPEDNALTGKFGWENNNRTFKPQFDTLGAGMDQARYSYVPDNDPQLSVRTSWNGEVRAVTLQAEAMGFVTRSRTKAVGCNPNAKGSIRTNVDMTPFGFGKIHSAQWCFDLQHNWKFWKTLYNELKLSENQ